MINKEAKIVFVLQFFFALVAVVGAITFIVQIEISALLSLIVVFLLPLMSLTLWFFRRNRGIIYSGTLRQFSLVFRLVTIVCWCILLLPGFFWGAIFFHIYEPWPFSLNQGPDTAYGEQGYQKVLGFDLAADVKDVYYKGYEIRDYDRYLRFSSCSKTLEDKLVVGLQKILNGDNSPPSRLNSKLSWWFSEAESLAFERWVGGYKPVWLHRETCTFYLNIWTT